MLIITGHAYQRFLERFPGVSGCLRERVERAVPFGGQRGSDKELRLDTEYDVVYVLAKDKKSSDVYLITVLTKDQALANMSAQNRYTAWSPAMLDEKRSAQTSTPITEKAYADDHLRDLAAIYAKRNNYCFPPLDERKLFSRQIREQHGYTLGSVDKYFWPEVGRLIYDYNAKHRTVAADDA